MEGFFNLIGFDSPGLTAAPAIGEYVAGLLGGRGAVTRSA